MKTLMYIAVLFSLIAPKILSISTGIFQLSVFRAIVLISPIILLFSTIKNNKKIIIYKENNQYSIYFMTIWMLYAICSVIWAQDTMLWLRGVFFIVIGTFCIFMFQNAFNNKFDILYSFRLMGIAVIMHNIIGWFEIITGKYYFANAEVALRYIRTQRPVSTYGNVNDYSLLMFFGVFILYVCYKNSQKFVQKLIYLLSIISVIIIIIVASSRGIILGLSLAFITYLFIEMKISKFKKIIVSIMLTALIFSITVIFVDKMLLHSLDINNSYVDLNEEVGRINLIKNGMYFLLRTYGFGVGAGNIEHWMLYEGIYPTGRLLNIHNWWAEILVGFGGVIFVLYLVFYIKLFKSMLYKYKASNDLIDRTISLAIMCCMTGYTVASVSSSSNMDFEWLWVFWALAIAYQGINNKMYKNNQN